MTGQDARGLQSYTFCTIGRVAGQVHGRRLGVRGSPGITCTSLPLQSSRCSDRLASYDDVQIASGARAWSGFLSSTHRNHVAGSVTAA